MFKTYTGEDALSMKVHNEPKTKELLLKAALRVFASKGYIAATVREICQEAGVNVAAVNYHFGDKEQLYATVLWSMFEEYSNLRDPDLWAVANGDGPVEERLRAHIRLAVNQIFACDSNHELCADNLKDKPFSIFLMEMAHPSPSLDAIVEEFIKPEADQLGDILRSYFGPDIPEDVLVRCGDSIWGQIMHQIMCWPIDQRLYGREKIESIDIPTLADHIFEFTIGGFERIKARLSSGKGEES